MVAKIRHRGKNLLDDYFNYKLRNARVSAGYNGEGLAKKVGVSKTMIYHYERLRATPCEKIAKKLAKVLHRKVSELFPEKLRKYSREIQSERYKDSKDVLDHSIYFKDGFGFRVRDSSGETLPVIAGKEELGRRIEKVLGTLSYREREIISLRYGLGDGYSYSLSELSYIFKVTRERIRQIEKEAIRKLQQPSRAGELVGFLD